MNVAALKAYLIPEVVQQYSERDCILYALGIGLGESNSGLSNFGLEVWYKFQVTDNISVTPALFWIENNAVGLSDTWGGLVKTTFRF